MESTGGKVEGSKHMIFCKGIANLMRLWYQMHHKTLSLFFTAKPYFIFVLVICLEQLFDLLH